MANPTHSTAMKLTKQDFTGLKFTSRFTYRTLHAIMVQLKWILCGKRLLVRGPVHKLEVTKLHSSEYREC